jgi:hypothetical protein
MSAQLCPAHAEAAAAKNVRGDAWRIGPARPDPCGPLPPAACAVKRDAAHQNATNLLCTLHWWLRRHDKKLRYLAASALASSAIRSCASENRTFMRSVNRSILPAVVFMHLRSRSVSALLRNP